MDMLQDDRHKLRDPCRCGSEWGRIVTRNGQDCVFCLCGKFRYNAPKTETGRKTRSISTVHEAIKPNQRARILFRATGRCEMCGNRRDLHVGHLISVDAGLKLGMTEAVINSDDNLSAMCPECNLGIGKYPVPLRLAIAMVMARVEVEP